MAEKETVKGRIEEVVYRNPQNDYSVVELLDESDRPVTAVGILPGIAEGEEVTLYGNWTHHASYGRQFSVESYEKQLPSDVHAILRYLSTGGVRGIGPVTAAKIVSRYGEESFDVIENHPEWLADIPGISPRKAAAISEAFREQAGVRSVMMFCRNYFGAAAAARVYRRFGTDAVGRIREDPYCLCSSALGISFHKADEIAAAMGVEAGSPVRIRGGLIHLLRHSALSGGHSCLPQEKLLGATGELLGVPAESVGKVLTDCLTDGRLVAYETAGEEGENRRYIYLPETASAENYVAERLIMLDRLCPAHAAEDIGLLIARAEKEQGIRYARLQREAIHAALTGGVLLLTGGPGTGKTTVVLALLRIFEHLGSRVSLAAPTGRAAQRMTETTGREARTIHRMLEMERSDDEEAPHFNRNERNPLEEDVYIIDEASMMDLPLTCGLLRAMRNGSRLIFIGDADQLPSVGSGNVLCDLIASGVFATVRLTEIFRQAEDSLIVTNAHRINQGMLPLGGRTEGDFFLMPRSREEEIPPLLLSLVETRLPKVYGEQIRSGIQIITPSRKGQAGTEALNRLMQAHLNPPSPDKQEMRDRDRVFREGDRVMQVRNDYGIEWERDGQKGSGIFNGDIGELTEIDPVSERFRVRYDDRVAVYDYDMAEEIEHAYAITVHKSQGSEYPVVILPLYACAPQLLTRNLLYTAVTRARRLSILVGRRDILEKMVENNRHDMRYTGLVSRLQKAAHR